MTASACPSRRRAAELEALKFVTNSGIWPDPAPLRIAEAAPALVQDVRHSFFAECQGTISFPNCFYGYSERAVKQANKNKDRKRGCVMTLGGGNDSI
jgi:hypothetical protein